MKKILSICLLFIIVICSCNSKEKDELLTIPFKPYTGNDLKLNGYYYYTDTQNQVPLTRVYFLYQSGVVIYAGSFQSKNLNEIEKQFATNDNYKQSKVWWGVFNINPPAIVVEQWNGGSGGKNLVIKQSAKIINDSTFIVDLINWQDGRQFNANQTFHFQPFSPKPDSTNSFIP
jgi:hypothetical protein